MNRRQSNLVSPVDKSLLWGASILALTMGLATAPLAHAADQPASQVSEVVITGSRIARRDFVAPSPIVTVTNQQLTKTAEVGLEAQLNKLPQFVPGNTQFSGAGDVQESPTNTPGAATLNLRGLGPNRNLVLLDGRRAQPFNASLAIDLNSLPSAAVDNVEIITGGAAAVYGADAIAGVVNFKLKRNFTGVEFDGQYGVTGHGDGQEYQASVLIGASLADNRGNVMLGLNYANRDPILQRDRSFFSAAYTDPLTNADIFLPIPQFSLTDPTGFVSNPPSQAAVDCVFSGVGVGCPFPARVPPGTVASAPGGNLFGVNTDGTLFAPGAANGANPASPKAVGYTGPLAPEFKIIGTQGTNGLEHNNLNAMLSLPLRRYSAFGNGHYDITDDVTAYAQAMFTETRTTSTGGFVPASIAWSAMIPYNSNPNAIDPATVGFGGATLPQYVGKNGCAAVGGCTFGQDHAVPAQLAYLLNSRSPATGGPNGAWDLNMELPYLGPTTIQNTTTTYQVLSGLRGKIPDAGILSDWTWDLYGSHGQTTVITDYTSGFVNTAAYQTLIAQPFFGAGYSNANNFLGRKATCTSGLPVFQSFTPSSDCLDIIAARMKATTSIEQNIAELDLQGGLFQLPAGQLRAALGADYRFDGFAFKPDPTMTNSNILSSASGVFDVSPAHGSTSVKEIYGELLVPVVKDLVFAKAFNLELGARYSSYNAAGSVGTYKALGDWTVVDWLRFRGGYQLANRAPNVAELFEPPTTIVTTVPNFDACSSITTAPYGNTASNPNRTKVLALCTALSHGVPITPTFLGLGAFSSLALDQQIGNPNLRSESATTWTAGTVLKSPWPSPLLSRLTASVDWYNIKINHAITGLTSSTVYEQCFNAFGSNPNYDPNNSYCKLIHRDGLFGFPAGVDGIYTNIGAIRTSGIDVQVDWSASLSDFSASAPGSVYLNLVLNYLSEYAIQEAPGAAFVDYAGTNGNGSTGSQFRWKMYTTLGYTVGPANASLSWRHLPSLKNTTPGALPNSAYDEFDLAGAWKLLGEVNLRAGVDNLFDAQPPIVGRIPGVNNATGITDAGNYDTIGRRFYVGLRARF
jgi:outer membrane receptor protein involved in Fe transport